MKLALSIALICFLTMPASSEDSLFDSGNGFLRACESMENQKLAGSWNMTCTGYVAGMVDGVDAEHQIWEGSEKKKAPKPFCVPDGVENGQLVRVVLKYIREHPEKSHNRTPLVVAYALHDGFPCGE